MDDDLHNTQAAAGLLANALPDEGDSAYWSHYLINNRRADRTPVHRIPVTRIGNGAFYASADLGEFIEFERNRRIGTVKLSGRAAEALRAFGIGEQGGGTQGRRFKGASVNRQAANGGSGEFIQVIIEEPLIVFALTPDQAIEFGKKLADAGKAARRTNEPAQPQAPDLTGYTTVADNSSVKIMRRVKK